MRIPFTTAIIDGKPDFRTNDQAKVKQCLEARLCGVCGKPLGYWIFFVGGPECARQRAYRDVPMHELCMQEALSECPFLSGQRGYSERPAKPGVVEDARVRPTTTEIIAYKTRSYDYKLERSGLYLIRPAPAVMLYRRERPGVEPDGLQSGEGAEQAVPAGG